MIKDHKQLLLVYCINQGMHWFGVGIVIPVMILVLLELGFNIGQVGVAMAIMSFTVLVLELPTGGLADSVGRKKIYLIAVCFYIAGYALMFFVSAFIYLIGVVILIGTGRALSSGTIDAWFIDEHKKLKDDENLLQKDLAKAGVIVPAALGCGTLTGGFFPDLTGSYKSNILVLVFLYCVQLLLTSALIKENKNDFSGSFLEGFKNFPSVLGSAVKYGFKSRNTLIILIATALLGVGLAGLEQLWQPEVKELAPGSGSWILGVLSAGYFLAASAGNWASTLVLKLFKYRYRFLLFCFRFLMATFYICLSFILKIQSFALLYFLTFLAHGVTGAPELTVFNRNIPSERRSTLLSLNSLFLQGGGGIGSLIAGYTALKASISVSWRITGGLLAVSAFFYLFIKEKTHEDKIQSCD